MIEIVAPLLFSKEKEYILNTIFTKFLGLEIKIIFKDTKQYKIILPNKKEVIFNNDFFSKIKTEETYLRIENIPSEVQYIEKSRFISEDNLPVIYGDTSIKILENYIVCGVDIFASSFFMLTRWEEYVITQKDKHARFPDKLSLAYKNNFYKRPIVNEYVEMLWNIMYSLDSSITRKERTYSKYITHDVDEIRRYDSITKYLKALAGDVISRKNPFLWFKTTTDFFTYTFGLRKDIYDTFDYLMDISEKHNTKSHFYFMPNKLAEIDARYDVESKIVKTIINNIEKRNHIVGIHGSYDGYNKPDVFRAELNRLRLIHNTVTEGRQHYLRFTNPLTWQIWEDNGLKKDSTVGYQEFSGFRAGVCYEYNVFNILTRETLNIIEQPLIAMEVAVRNQFKDVNHFVNDFLFVSEKVKKYNGKFVLLWHNNNFNNFEWRKYSKEYEHIISKI